MSIVVIGGLDKMHKQYKSIGSQNGHKLKVYTKQTTQFNKMLGSPDAMVLLTDTVSHNMVKIAVKEAKKQDIPVIRTHGSSLSSLKDSIRQLEMMVQPC